MDTNSIVLDTATVALVAAAGALFGVMITAFVNLWITKINRNKSYNDWRREKVWELITKLNLELRTAFNLSINNKDRGLDRSGMYVNYINCYDLVNEISSLIEPDLSENLRVAFKIKLELDASILYDDKGLSQKGLDFMDKELEIFLNTGLSNFSNTVFKVFSNLK
ncbi:hypothetical protein [Yersinia intermedia]|jgi:hypothetical protein|uniref:hypothetical protein n=1 Tax=Yersinia intermedia TaxID=631 RepID=UPI0005E88DE6|nr:hypothetical protein [Yersinia intermedia]MCB5311819.1 hypothetical protein [Yersinia intermedia]MCB5327828.1 hypothetical protein [Yersinia intermedia]CNB16217.1 Uncharacterised protein [Yersinia intermedia]CQJ67345.1 Uncharacterised protein [Yersinia intermedia]CRE41627.1 Uncharacterised protein [Yersinia intermedia]